jgi:hypothetical protein
MLIASLNSIQAIGNATIDAEGLFDDLSTDVPVGTKENPWLTANSTSAKVSRAKNEVVVNKNSNAAALSKNALKKRMRKTAEATAIAKDDAILEIDPNVTMIAPEVNKPKKSNHKSTGQLPAERMDTHNVDAALVDDDTTDDERNAQQAALDRRKGRFTAFEQRELVAQAFAGDNVVEVSYFSEIIDRTGTQPQFRNSPPRNDGKWKRMPLKRWIPLYQDG